MNAGSTSIPIATGERLFTRWGFQDIIARQAVAIVQPDLSHVGGISEARKIAAMAEPRGIALAPHCPLGPIALAACLQVDACTPNFLCQEHVTLGEGYLKRPFVVKDGYIPLPAKVVAGDANRVVFTGQDIKDGQNVWQSLGGQEVGSVWGHGAYVAPDWSADWLHRESVFLLDRWAGREYSKSYEQLNVEQQAGLRQRLKSELRPNRTIPPRAR